MTPPDSGPDRLERRVRRHQTRLMPIAAAALMWESLWPRLWPVVGIIGVFVALSLLDVFPLLPFWLHGMVLLGFAAAAAWAARSGLRTFRPPTRHEARLRIERDSHLRHRPLAALDEETVPGAGNNSATNALWNEHRRRAALASGRLRVSLPSPGMARFDPYGLRVAVALLLVIAMAAGFENAGVRMARALVPVDAGSGADTRVDVWVTPPAYTGYPPFHVFMAESETEDQPNENYGENYGEVRTIPVGSSILAAQWISVT